jgi:hypothetical protein
MAVKGRRELFVTHPCVDQANHDSQQHSTDAHATNDTLRCGLFRAGSPKEWTRKKRWSIRQFVHDQFFTQCETVGNVLWRRGKESDSEPEEDAGDHSGAPIAEEFPC